MPANSQDTETDPAPSPTSGRASRTGHVVLIGLMGSGKSAVGAEVANRTGLPFVDVDTVIHERTGMTVRELWERGGEVTYRPLERDTVLHVLAGEGPDVLATPAGAVLDHLVQEALDVSDSFTVWLRADPVILAGRVSPSDHRPLLGQDPLGTLRAMADERSATYEALADLILDVEQHDPQELASRVIAAYGARSGPR